MRDDVAAVSRRLFLCGSTATLAACGGSPAGSDPPPGGGGDGGKVGIVDTHVHLFNASDLPIAGFAKYTVLRAWADLWLVRAAIDVIAEVVKPFAMTVEEELDQLQRKTPGGPPATSPERFAGLAANAGGGQAPDPETPKRGRRAPLTPELKTGYDQLVAALLAGYADDAARASRLLAKSREASDPALDRRERYDAFLRLAQAAGQGQTEEAAARALRLLPALRDILAAHRKAALNPLGVLTTVFRMLEWAYIMMQPRAHHLERYLATFAAPDAQPAIVVNLLIDYDLWLDDRAEPASSIDRQIAFWAQAAERYKDRVELKTFAPYCPLKHAIDRRAHPDEPYLESLTARFREGKIAGLKFYPPMGYRALGNAALQDADFVGTDGIGRIALKAWRQGGAAGPLGKALDDALLKTYDRCVDLGVPVLAHAGPSNYAASNFADRPDPKYWGDVAGKYPDLHIMLGHFAFNAKHFVDAMSPPPKPPTPAPVVWAITSTAGVLKAHPNVFVDLAYVNEILGRSPASTKLAEDFFKQLRVWAQGADPNLDQIAYGSDWIMLQQEKDQARYLTIMRAEAKRPSNGWKPDEVERLFVGNAKRFLSPKPRQAA